MEQDHSYVSRRAFLLVGLLSAAGIVAVVAGLLGVLLTRHPSDTHPSRSAATIATTPTPEPKESGVHIDVPSRKTVTNAAKSAIGAALGRESHTSTPPEATPTADAASAMTLDEEATDTAFSATSFTVPANQPVTLRLHATGRELHNFDVLDARDVNGKVIKTSFIGGGKTATLTFTISKPGIYTFQDDLHPSTLKGTLTVQ